MSDEAIIVEVTRSGGFAGVRRTGRVNTADLDSERAETLRRLVTEADVANRRGGAVGRRATGADRFQYDIAVVRGDDRRSFVVGEDQLSDADRRLLRWVLAEGRGGR